MKLARIMKVLSLVVLAALAIGCLAGCAATGSTTTGTADGSAAGGGMSMIVILVVMIVVFYFFLIRPENKKKKQLEQMRSQRAVRDDVTTIGGIVGKIVAVKDDFIVFETSEDRVRIQVAKWAISTTGKAKTEEQANTPSKD